MNPNNDHVSPRQPFSYSTHVVSPKQSPVRLADAPSSSTQMYYSNEYDEVQFSVSPVPPAATRKVSGGRHQRTITSPSASPGDFDDFNIIAANSQGINYNEMYSQMGQSSPPQQKYTNALGVTVGSSMPIQPASASTYNPSSSGSSSYFAVAEKLRQDLELEQIESQNLDRQLRETRKRLENALQLQSQLENDLVDMAKEVGNLQTQLRDHKKMKRDLENELSQEQVTNVNEKQQWLDKEQQQEKTVAKLREENTRFKAQIKDLQHTSHNNLAISSDLANVKEKPAATHHKYFSINSFASFTGIGGGSSTSSAVSSPTLSTSSSSSTSSSPQSIMSTATSISSTSSNTSAALAAKDKTIERLKNELDQLHQQTELVSREYALRHDQIENEMQQQKTLVGRLMEENEGFQYLLAEKAILGGFADTAELTPGGDLRNGSTPSLHSVHSSSSIDRQKVIHSGNSLADELDRISLASSNDEDYGLGGEQTPETRKRMNDLEFEAQSLRNHNKALSLSLERLVQRLLEFKEFESEVETSTMSGSINAHSISQFQTRVASSATSINSGAHLKSDTASLHSVSRHKHSNSITSIISNSLGPSPFNNALTPAKSNSSYNSLEVPPPLRRTNPDSRRDSGTMSHSSVHQLNLPFSSNSVGPRGGRHFKNPVLWNSMILGGGGGAAHAVPPGPRSPLLGGPNGSLAPSHNGGGSGGSATSSMVNGTVGHHRHSKTLDATSVLMQLGIDSDSPPSSSSSSTSSSSGSESGAAGNHSRSSSNTSSTSGGEVKQTPVAAGATTLDVNSTPRARRPSTAAQREFRPLSMYHSPS